MCNLRPPSIRPVLMSAVILLFICSVTVAGEPQIAYRFQSGMPGADHCQAVVTSGYTDGVDLGMTGEVWMLDKDGYRVKAGSLEVMEVNAYMSVCLLDGIALEDNIANANVRFEMKEWTPKEYLQKAGLAFSAGDFKKARYFYSLIISEYASESSDLVTGRLGVCDQKIQQQISRVLSDEEKERRRGSNPVYYQLAVCFFCHGEYVAAREYIDKILKVEEGHEGALELLRFLNNDSPEPPGFEEKQQSNYPAPDDFVPVDKMPEMTKEHSPEFPKQAEREGVQGTVWVKALVGTDGKVHQATVGKSSGFGILDFTAIKAAYKNKYSPAEQKGQAVSFWVSYKVEFIPYPLAGR